MTTIRRVLFCLISLVALCSTSHRASAVSICFGECSKSPSKSPELLHNVHDGRVFFRELDFYEVRELFRGLEHLLPTNSLSLRITGPSEKILPQNAQPIPIAGAPTVATRTRSAPIPIADDLHGDGQVDVGTIPADEETLTSITWEFPDVAEIDLMSTVYAGKIVAPGVALDEYSFEFLMSRMETGNITFTGFGKITVIPEPTSAALFLIGIVSASLRRRW